MSRRPPASSDRRFRKPAIMADQGPLERWQHTSRLLVLTDRAGVLAAKAATENTPDILLERGWITARHHEAALLLQRDFQRAGLAARVSGSYNQSRQDFNLFSGWDERSDSEERAYQRWRRIVLALPAEGRALVIASICQDEMPPLQQAQMLRECLDLLAKAYGLPRDSVARQ